ncbi:MAG: PAS domain-containing protein [Myxococcales bacterium]|nr:PAS domain-containing protein [Myxococcales bacterium]MCB9520506.1 PAS domain-containing protein [Myxococcales bacterium]
MNAAPHHAKPSRRYRWGFALLVLAVAAVSAASVTYVREIETLRRDVEERVGWLSDLRDIDRTLTADPDPAAVEATVADVSARIAETDPEIGALAQRAADASSADDAHAALGSAVDAIRAQTATLSEELGARFAKLRALAGSNALLGIVALLALTYGRTRDLHARRAAVRADELAAQVDFLVTASPAVLYTASLGAGHDLVFVSRNAARIFGFSPDDLARPGARESWIHPDDLARANAGIEAALAHGRHVHEYRVRTVTGAMRPVRDECRVATELDPQVLVGCLLDVSDRKFADAALERAIGRANSLAALNAELETFARAATEQLAQPARRVGSLVDLLAGGDAAADQRDEWLALLRSDAHRLYGLAEDLVAYAHAASSPWSPTRVDLDDVADEVIAALAPRIAETGAGVRRSPLGVAWAERAGVVRALTILLENALDFASPGAPPDIHLAGHRVDDEGAWCEISVSDQGLGFDGAQAALLFAPFARPHADARPSGHGVSLATAARIAERNGGRIGATSEGPGMGATFTLTLPLDFETSGALPTSHPQRPADDA